MNLIWKTDLYVYEYIYVADEHVNCIVNGITEILHVSSICLSLWKGRKRRKQMSLHDKLLVWRFPTIQTWQPLWPTHACTHPIAIKYKQWIQQSKLQQKTSYLIIIYTTFECYWLIFSINSKLDFWQLKINAWEHNRKHSECAAGLRPAEASYPENFLHPPSL